MSVYKITCPHCKAVMKSPKPVPAGKKVKRARCGDLFAAKAVLEADEAPEKAKPDAKAVVKAGSKSAKPSPAPKKPADDDDDEGGTYSFVPEKEPEEGEDDERAKQRKEDLEFALDTSIKDLRGPAQAAVVMPSNLLILTGAIPFLLYFFAILWMLWPFFFAERIVPPGAVFNWDTSPTPIYKEYKELSEAEKRQVDAAQWAFSLWGISLRITIIAGAVFGMILAGLVTYGGVKMQMLESWGWSMAAAIITLASGSGLGILIGVWCIIVLNDPKVKAGFVYRSEGEVKLD